MFDGEEPSFDKLNRAMQVLRAFLRTKERSVPEKPVGESSRPIFSVQKASFAMLTPSPTALAAPIYLSVYFPYEIMFIEITLPGRKKKGNSIFFLYFVASIKKASR
jgi:hypothetical protein